MNKWQYLLLSYFISNANIKLRHFYLASFEKAAVHFCKLSIQSTNAELRKTGVEAWGKSLFPRPQSSGLQWRICDVLQAHWMHRPISSSPTMSNDARVERKGWVTVPACDVCHNCSTVLHPWSRVIINEFHFTPVYPKESETKPLD